MEPRSILVVITVMTLSPEDPRCRPRSIERLTAAAKDRVGADPQAASDILPMNRPETRAGDEAA